MLGTAVQQLQQQFVQQQENFQKQLTDVEKEIVKQDILQKILLKQGEREKGSNTFSAEGIVWGMLAEGQGRRERLCCRLISDSIFWLFYFTPTLASRCNALPKKVPKELYKRKDSNR